jgi:hypothetical protein
LRRATHRRVSDGGSVSRVSSVPFGPTTDFGRSCMVSAIDISVSSARTAGLLFRGDNYASAFKLRLIMLVNHHLPYLAPRQG